MEDGLVFLITQPEKFTIGVDEERSRSLSHTGADNSVLFVAEKTGQRSRDIRSLNMFDTQMIGLAQALLPDPDLVILDEPTSGLDPLGRRLVRDVIHQLKAAGTAVFLNSHLLSEVEVTCDRVAFIKEGRVVRTARLGALVEGLTEVVLQVGQVTPELLEGLRRWSNDLRVDGRRITMTIQDEEILPHLSQWVVDQRAGLYALTPQQISLEELFVSVVEGQA